MFRSIQNYFTRNHKHHIENRNIYLITSFAPPLALDVNLPFTLFQEAIILEDF